MRTAEARFRAHRAGLVVAALAASSAVALADDPKPAAAAPAPAPAAAEEPRPGPKTEFLSGDMVKRPDGMIVHYYRVNHVSPQILARELEIWKTPKAQIGPSGPEFTSPPPTPNSAKGGAISGISNVLRIVETEENWPVLARILRMIDVPQPQVRVEAKVVELAWDDQLKLGVSAKVSRPVGDTFFQSSEITFPNPLDAQNSTATKFRSVDKYLVFDYAVNAVEQGAKAEVQSKPSILASQGESAVIRSGDKEPYVRQNLSGNTVTTSTEFQDVGVKLEVQPVLVGRDMIRVRVFAESSRLSDFRITATSANQQVVNPVISTRSADTVVTVPDGATLVIGGLDQTTKRDVRTGFPLLMDLPGLGYLFSSTTKRDQRSELVFFITLTIETPEEARLFVPPTELERADSARGAAK